MSEKKKPGFMKLEVTRESQRAPAPSQEPVKPRDPLDLPPGETARITPQPMSLPPAGAGEVAKTNLMPASAYPSEVAPRMPLVERADLAAHVVREALKTPARIAVVLGSGLGAFGEALEERRAIPYASIPGFPRSTVAGHAGQLAVGLQRGVPIYVMQGRFHYYEGYSLEDVTFPIRVLARLGVKLLVVTNAAGAVAETLAPGDIMLITDQLNLIGESPLRGPNDERLGPRFPDMSEAYPERLRAAVLAAAPKECALKQGVYAALAGPQYETPAEIRMLQRLGADAVGMSTVPEVIVANHMGMSVVGLSGIANMAAGLVKGKRLTHVEVVENMARMSGKFAGLLGAAIPSLVAHV